MTSVPIIDVSAAAADKLDAIKHVTWICESLRYAGWASLLVGGGIFFRGLAAFLAVLRPRR